MSLHRRHRLHLGHIRWHHRRVRPKEARPSLGPDFTKLWAAGIASNIADGIGFAALPLLAAVLTRDPFQVALVAVVHSLPWFGFELIAGEIVDRADRKQLMLWGNLARGAGIASIAVLVAADALALPLLYGIAFAIGVAETLVDTSWEALVPRLVPESRLELANGRTQAAEWTANELIGPPLGGLLFATAAAAPFFVDASAFVIAALLVAWIPGTFRSGRTPVRGKGSIRRDIGEGMSWLWRHRLLRTLSLTAGIANLVSTATMAVFVLFAQELLGLSDAGFGLLLATGGVGGVIGAAMAHRVQRRLGPAPLLLMSTGGMGLAAFAIALTSSPLVVAAAFALDGFLIAMWNVVVVSLRQSLTPDELRGRVSADARTIAFGAVPIGALLGGVLAETLGLRSPFFLAAAAYAAAVILMTRVVSNREVAVLKAQAAEGRA